MASAGLRRLGRSIVSRLPVIGRIVEERDAYRAYLQASPVDHYTRLTVDERQPPVIEIVAVAYRQPGPLRVFVECFLAQTDPNWRLHVMHDGPDDAFIAIMQEFAARDPQRVTFEATAERANDFGHSLRAHGLQRSTGDYVLLTNADNYYVPAFIGLVSQAIRATDADVVLYDMIHSHNFPGKRILPPYSLFQTAFRRDGVDMGAAVVRGDLARAAGFRDRSYAADATYFEDVAARAGGNPRIAKLGQVLFFHN